MDYNEFMAIGKELTRLTAATTSLEEWRSVVKEYIAKYGEVFANFVDCHLFEEDGMQCSADVCSYTDKRYGISGKGVVITNFVPWPDDPYGMGDSIELLTVLL